MRTLVLFLLLFPVTSPAVLAGQNPTAPTVTTVAATATDRFTDAGTVGRPETDFIDKFVRFVTGEHPGGVIARVKSFNPATGEFTLYTQLPAGVVKQNDSYQISATSEFSSGSAADAMQGCTPAGTAGRDIIVCTGADTTGVTAAGGHDTVTINADATVDVSAAGIRSPEATAVNAGDGNDAVTNSGALSGSATAVFTPILTPPSPVGLVSKIWAAAIATSPDAKGIDGGAGIDTITNTSTGSVGASATSVLLPSIVNGTVEGLSKADVSSTSKADATAIAGAAAADTVTNNGTLDTSTVATALGVNVVMTSVVEAGKGGTSTIRGDVKADATSTGISTGDGNDSVTNTATFGATATAASIAAAASTLDAKGSVAASAKATGESAATAIELGDGNDTLTNLGDLTATANATAHAVNVGIAENNPPPTDKKEKVKAAVDGGAKAEATAIGIGADSLSTKTETDPVLINDGVIRGLSVTVTKAFASGHDEVTNAAAVGVSATAQSGAAGVTAGMSIDGSATAKVTSEAEARAAAVDLGGGNDKLTNTATGQLTAVATATAQGLNASIVAKSDPAKKGEIESATEGSVKAEADATGLAADSLRPDVTYAGTLTTGDGFNLQISETKTRASGNDEVTNSGAVSGTATANAGALGAAVAFDGKATAKMSSSAEAGAAGVDLGGGNDTLTNTATGQLTADATATASGLNVALGLKTDTSGKSEAKSTVEGSVEAKSQATGLAGDNLAPDRTREATLAIGGGALGVDVKEVETRAAGNDTVTNDGIVTANATSNTEAGGLGVSIDGKTTAKIDSKAQAAAAGIDLGGGNDSLTNSGTGGLSATADATAAGLNATIGVKTDPSAKGEVEGAAEGSVEAKSQATGLGADSLIGDKTREASLTIDSGGFSLKASESETRASGNDAVTNNGAVTATATSSTVAGGVGITINGEASAKITSEAESQAAGIDLGGGGDKLTNSGTLSAGATSAAGTLNVAIGVSGESSSAKPGESKSKTAADGSAKAESRATGLAADSASGDTTRSAEIAFGSGALTLDYSKTESRASGNDEVTNTGAITATSNALSGAVGVGVTVKGAASANSKSTAESSAVGIDLGGGEDRLTNSGDLQATASSTSGALKVAVSTEGRATTSDGLWQGGIKSQATAAGIDAGGVNSESTSARVVIDNTGIHGRYETINDSTGPVGRDVVTNTGSIVAGASSFSGSANVSVTSEGLAAAISHAEAEAKAAGVATGNGNDDINNLGAGTVTVTSNAEAAGLKVVASGKGQAVAADALWDAGTKSEATAIGINSDAGELEKMLITASIDGNGVLVEHEKTKTVSSGSDTILNTQAVGVSATASAPSLSVALEAKKGIAAVVSKVASEAEAAAVRAGGGNDVVTNRGALTSTANVTAETANVSIAKEGVAAASDSVWDGGTKAEAAALGIDADGPGNESKKTTLTVNSGGATIVHTDTKEAATGNDTVVNEARIDADATATARSLGVAMTAKGLSAALSQSTAKAESSAIRGGDGHDAITNTALLTSTAASSAQAASVAVTVEKGVAAAGNAVWDGGITAESTAVGIEGDGGEKKSTTTLTLKTGGGGDIDKGETKEAASGNDTIVNSGDVTATASATAPEVSVSIATKGVAAAVSTSTAKSNAAAIDAGGGDDEVSNTGKLTADATSLAVAINGTGVDKGVAISANNSWDGGVKADARARGIDGGAGLDSLTNASEISSHSKATAPSVSAAVALTGVPVAVSTATATSNAVAIDAGGGTEADEVVNRIGGKLTSHAEALAATANVAVTNQGLAIAADAVWDGGTKAEATAKGVDTGQGADTVTNFGEVGATSDAIAASAAVSVAVTGVAAATATSTAASRATAIDTGDGQDADILGNFGRLLAKSNAFAGSASVSVTNSGVSAALDAVWDGGTRADAIATGISTGGLDDLVTNTSLIEALSDAKTGAAAVSVAVSGVAGASATSTGTSIATAIDTGETHGVDRVTNTGKLVAEADALAISTSVSVTNAGVALAADAVWDGGTTADATARGIRTGLGADVIGNTADVEARADAITGSAAVSVAVSGVAAAIATSTGKAQATAIDSSAADVTGTGNDADDIANAGKLTAESSAIAATVTVGVTTAGVSLAGDAAWDGGTKAETVAKGIATGTGADKVVNDGEITATSDAKTVSANVSVAVSGAAGAVGTSTGTSNATAIDAGDGADTIVNTNTGLPGRTGKLTAEADALAAAATVSVTTAGVAVAADSVWDGGTKAEATAKGIDAGLGADTVTNESAIEARSGANTASAAVSVAVTGVAGAIASSTSKSAATAIDAGFGAGGDTIANAGTLKATADALAISAAIGFTTAGLSVAGNSAWDGGTLADAIAQGIAGSVGADRITNSNLVETTANSDAVSASVSVAVQGVAGAVSTATSKGQSTSIDGGAGNDVIQNLSTGELKANADATGVAVNVGITGIGVTAAADSVWDGGTKAEATAKGIHGGAGLDTITNDALISANAESTTVSTAVSLTGIGAGGAISTSTSTANATAIDGGADADAIANRANLTAISNATGTGVAVTVTGIGGSVGGDAFWDGGTAANANSIGIAGGAGDDSVANTANKVIADATSKTNSVSVAVTGVGLAGVAAGSTSTARATVIDGQEGIDAITNDRALEAKASSTASGVGVAATLAGGSGAGTFVDNVTKAEAVATGLAGGAHADVITNTAPASVTLTSDADSTDTNVSVTLVGVADGSSQALTIARGTGIDGGDGSDTLTNSGSITGNLTSNLKARSVAVSLGGAFGNASGTAETIGAGLAGGNDSDVVLNNGQISLTSSSTASGQSVSVGVTGGTMGDASGTGRATLFGLAGDAGNDTVTNNGIITLLPTANAFGQNVGVSVLGGSVNDASARSFATAIGLAGGAGDDTLTNNRAITATITASTTARSTGVVVAGSALNKSNSESEAASIGIDGGDQADRIINALAGTIDVRSNAGTTANSVVVGVAGSTNSEAVIRPVARATGLEGGAGGDEVVNEGNALVRATATGTSSNSTTQIFGSSGAKAGATTDAVALGIGGGAGDDLLVNRNRLDVGAGSNATVTGSSWTLAGGAAGNSALTASGGATGMSGGIGSDVLRNHGTIIVDAGSTLTATGGSSAIFGGAGSNTQLAAAVTGTGLSGGDGANTVENFLNLDVNSTATTRSNKSSVSFAGSPSTDALLAARATSIGVQGGTDADVVTNDGTISVDAKAVTNVTGLTSADLGGNTTSSGFARADATAHGVDAGAGNNILTNTNVVHVEGITDAAVANSSSAGFFFSDGSTASNTTTAVGARGLVAGQGNNIISNNGDVRVSTLAAGHGFAYAVGGSFSIEGDANARSNVNVGATAAGISAGDGVNRVTNDGLLSVLAFATTSRVVTTQSTVCTERRVPQPPTCTPVYDDDGNQVGETCTPNPDVIEKTCTEETVVPRDEVTGAPLGATPIYAGANGNGASGDGWANATGTADAIAHGIEVGAGANTIVNNAEISVTAKPDARVTTFADGDAFGDATGISTATANATGVGIRAGNGNNVITNAGSLTVTAEPTARAEATVSGGDICIWYLFGTWCGGGGDGEGFATAVFRADATGIAAGGGDNQIVNEGSITVTARPVVDGFSASVSGDGGPEVSTSVSSHAVGIQTGSGNNTILNRGSISVEAQRASVCNGCGTPSLSAVGIQTGSGNDLIVNDGTISTSILSSGGSSDGISIDSGAGDDEVVLGESSMTVGAVSLGTGNDTLVWSAAAALTGGANAATGTDTFALGGTKTADFEMSQIGLTFNGFELFQKRGSSRWTLLGDRRIDWTVRDGTLAVADVVTGTIDTAVGGSNPDIAVLPTGTIRRDDNAAAAVLLRDGGHLTNDGLVEATASGGTAVQVFGSGSEIVNSGNIVSAADGIVVNGSDNVLVNEGLIRGAASAVRAEGAGTVVNNQISGTLAASGVTLALGHDTGLVNEGRIFGIGAGTTGILFSGDGVTAINRGLINAHTAAVQFDSSATSTGTLVNDAFARIQATNGVAVLGGDGSERIANHGEIIGGPGDAAIDLRAGDDELLITNRSNISGAAKGGAGFDTFIVSGAANGQFNLSNIGPLVNGFEIYRKQGSATWTLLGAGASDWTVDQGTLDIQGDVTGTVSTTGGATDSIVDIDSTGIVQRSDGGAAVVLNGHGTLANAGLVTTSAASAAAIRAFGSGNQIANSGDVQAEGIGIEVEGAGNALTNHGSVRGAIGGISVVGAGNSFLNSGLVQSAGPGAALSITGDANDITNNAEVDSRGIGIAVSGDGNAITNIGRIGTLGSAVSMSGRNSLSNAGLLQTFGSNPAVQAVGDSIAIENSGTVRASGNGIQLTGGDSSIFNRGIIESSGIGLQIAGSGNLFDNTGTLRSVGTGITLDGAGNAVTNTGLIDITGAGAALNVDGTSNRILNNGAIRAGDVGLQVAGQSNAFSNTGTVLGSGPGAAVKVTGGSHSISNTGFIEALGGGMGLELAGDNGHVMNLGEIRSSAVGLFMGGRSNTVRNDGLVSGGSIGVSTRGVGTSLTNDGAIVSNGIGVLMAGAGESLVNNGIVRATGAAIQVASATGVSTSITNAADAAIQSTGAAAIIGGDGNERVENHGLLAGSGVSVDLGGGNDVLHLSTTALMGGVARGGSGVDTVELAGPGAVRTDLGSYVGFETLTKQGTGTWVLTGSGNLEWTVNAGLLVVEGALGGQGLVRAGSRLGGAGAVGGFVNEGTLAPGNSIGMLRVLGDYEHAPGAVLEIEGAINGESDMLRIDGRALLRGGTVAVTPESRPFGIATEFTILDAAGGITGTFGRATSSLSNLDPSLDYESQKVFLTLIRNDISFAAMGTSANVQSLGTALDTQKKSMARGDFKILMDQFVSMDSGQQRAALESLNGELHAATARSLLFTGNRFFSASVDRQLSAQRVQDERKTFWTDAFGFSGSLNGDGNASGADYRAAGLAVGVDFMAGERTRIGGSMGFAPGSAELNALVPGDARVRSYLPAVYGEYDTGMWSIGTGFGYGRHDVRTTRSIEVGPIARQATADYRADQFSTLVSAGVSIHRTRSVGLKAFGELWYSSLSREPFEESGAASANLTSVTESRTDSLRTVLGLRASWEPNIWGARVKPALVAGWAHETLDHQSEMSGALAGTAALANFRRFTVFSVNEGRDTAVITVGASTAFVKHGHAFFSYDGNFSQSVSEHGFVAGVRISW